ncbi:MAG: hypothetical protein DI563_29055 [Variovorax paradoxus]|uniref:Uncharacterized protein n=1 Tax=Variovorax paradoxus TaxID=34073 RepID=A0A2W5RDM7_VARPD|nr:MAG: hypothetical protein DI563_29055 [Variovorax paradoxus]
MVRTLPVVMPTPAVDWLPTMATVPVMTPRLMTELLVPPAIAEPRLPAITMLPAINPWLTTELTVPPCRLEPWLPMMATRPVSVPRLSTLFTVPPPRASPWLPTIAMLAFIRLPLLRLCTLLTMPPPRADPVLPAMVMLPAPMRPWLITLLTVPPPCVLPWLPSTVICPPAMVPPLITLLATPPPCTLPRLPRMAMRLPPMLPLLSTELIVPLCALPWLPVIATCEPAMRPLLRLRRLAALASSPSACAPLRWLPVMATCEPLVRPSLNTLLATAVLPSRVLTSLAVLPLMVVGLPSVLAPSPTIALLASAMPFSARTLSAVLPSSCMLLARSAPSTCTALALAAPTPLPMTAWPAIVPSLPSLLMLLARLSASVTGTVGIERLCTVAPHRDRRARHPHAVLALEVHAVGHEDAVLRIADAGDLAVATAGAHVAGRVVGDRHRAAGEARIAIARQRVDQRRAADGRHLRGAVVAQREGRAAVDARVLVQHDRVGGGARHAAFAEGVARACHGTGTGGHLGCGVARQLRGGRQARAGALAFLDAHAVGDQLAALRRQLARGVVAQAHAARVDGARSASTRRAGRRPRCPRSHSHVRSRPCCRRGRCARCAPCLRSPARCWRPPGPRSPARRARCCC